MTLFVRLRMRVSLHLFAAFFDLTTKETLVYSYA
jgi:hypothetical protein